MDTATATRYDVRAITVDMSGVHYGPVVTRDVTPAIGPAAYRGYVLVTDGSETWDVISDQLVRV